MAAADDAGAVVAVSAPTPGPDPVPRGLMGHIRSYGRRHRRARGHGHGPAGASLAFIITAYAALFLSAVLLVIGHCLLMSATGFRSRLTTLVKEIPGSCNCKVCQEETRCSPLFYTSSLYRCLDAINCSCAPFGLSCNFSSTDELNYSEIVCFLLCICIEA